MKNNFFIKSENLEKFLIFFGKNDKELKKVNLL